MAVQHKLDYAQLIQIIENIKKGSSMDSVKVANFFVHYASGNSMKESAKLADVNESTAKSWKHTEWFPEAMISARRVVGQKVDRKLTKIIDMALGNLEERLVVGEPYKDGRKISFKPVGAYQSALIAGICFDKRALSRGEPTSIEAGISLEERLSGLHKTFEEVTNGKPALTIVEK